MSSPAALRGQAVRDRLLTAAVELISERGWSGVSTRILAERAGVSASVVHYHFPSMDVLRNEAVLRVIGGVVCELDAVLERAETPAGAVDAIFAAADHYTGTEAPSLAAIEAILAASRDDQLAESIRTLFDEFRQRFGRWLAAHGVPAPEDTAAVLIAATDGLLLQRCVGIQTSSNAIATVVRRLVITKDEV